MMELNQSQKIFEVVVLKEGKAEQGSFRDAYGSSFRVSDTDINNLSWEWKADPLEEGRSYQDA